MAAIPFVTDSKFVVAAGSLLSITGLAGCTISSMPACDFSTGQLSLFVSLAVTGILLVVWGSFVEARAKLIN